MPYIVGGGGSSTSFKYGWYTLSSHQTSNLSLDNHVEFDTASGSLDGLSTGVGQEKGIITLPAGKTYKLSGTALLSFTNQGVAGLSLYNITTASFIGNPAYYLSVTNASNGSIQPNFFGIITTTVDTEIELRINYSATNLGLINADYVYLLIEEYAGI